MRTIAKTREKFKPLESCVEVSESVLIGYFTTIKKVFTKFDNWLREITEPRTKNKIIYPIKSLMYLSLLMMLPSVKSRRHYTELFRNTETKSVLENILKEELPRIPDEDTLAYLWDKLSVKELIELKEKMINRLLRMKCLEQFKFHGRYLIAIDGTELYRFKNRHCKHCLFAKIKDKYQYFHRVLEAKLICNGMVFSIATEFIENSPDSEDDKQDCELKAFHRLAKKLKKLYPRLPITILADGLYPNGPVFARCQEYNWKYIFTLKDDVLKTVWVDFHGLFNQSETAIGAELEQPEMFDEEVRYRWQNSLSYDGKDFKGKVNILAKAGLNDKGEYETIRAFITNYKLKEESILEIENAGQQRVKIENEGFNIQKNHGYQLEHIFTNSPNGMKVVYLLIQIAHIINQLFVQADIMKVCRKLNSLRECFEKLISAIKSPWNKALEDKFNDISKKEFQLRFDSS